MTVKLEVRSKSPKGFRRAGKFFGPDPVEVDLEDIQAEAIMREEQLFSRRLDGGPVLNGEQPGMPAKPEPIASGLGDGSKLVPSDLTEGRPTDAKPVAKTAAPKVGAEPKPHEGEATPSFAQTTETTDDARKRR